MTSEGFSFCEVAGFESEKLPAIGIVIGDLKIMSNSIKGTLQYEFYKWKMCKFVIPFETMPTSTPKIRKQYIIMVISLTIYIQRLGSSI